MTYQATGRVLGRILETLIDRDPGLHRPIEDALAAPKDEAARHPRQLVNMSVPEICDEVLERLGRLPEARPEHH